MAEKQWMTYAEIARRLGISPDGVRKRAKGENWPSRKQTNNRNVEFVQVLVDPELLPKRTPEEPRKMEASAPDSTTDSATEIRALHDHVETLKEMLRNARTEAAEREIRLAAEASAAREDARQLVDQVRALTSQVAAAEQARAGDREMIGRLEAQLEEARKPIWKRILGK